MKKGIHIKRGKRGWLWNIVAGNGKVVANGETYTTKKGAKKGLLATASVLNACLNGTGKTYIQK